MEPYNLNETYEDANMIIIPKKELVSVERIRIGKMAIIFFILLLLLLFSLNFFEIGLVMLFVIILVIAEVLSIPVQLLRLHLYSKKCPLEMQLNESEIRMDNLSIPLEEIQGMVITHRNAAGKSIYPINRIMTIKTAKKKYKYWLGTESGLPYREYEKIVNKVEEVCEGNGIKLLQKR